MPKALESAHSQWVVDPDTRNERLTFVGHMRIVRSKRRAKLLRKRGVELDAYAHPTGAWQFWCWYETNASYDVRALRRKMERKLARHIRDMRREHGLDWADALLRGLLTPRLPPGAQSLLDKHGYYVHVGDSTPRDKHMRMSPPLTLYYNDPVFATRTPEQIHADIERMLQTMAAPYDPTRCVYCGCTFPCVCEWPI